MFYRLFHCSKCSAFLKVNEMVMRAQSRVYHADCFRCTTCRRLLTTGETFAERDGELYCKDDLDFIERNLLSSNDPDNLLCSDNNNHKMHPQDKRSSMLHGRLPFLHFLYCLSLSHFGLFVVFSNTFRSQIFWRF